MHRNSRLKCRKFSLVLVFVVVVMVLQLIGGTSGAEIEMPSDDVEAWNEFKSQFNKTYSSPEEEAHRRKVFLDNKRYVENFNRIESAKARFVQGVNPLLDLTTDEINESRTGFSPPESAPDDRFNGGHLLEQLLLALNQSLNQDEQDQSEWGAANRAWYDALLTRESLDYRDRGVVSRVKDQGACGSCWAFATTGALESALALRGNRVLLSEQNLVDCSRSYGNKGCRGGLMDAALDYVRDHGIMSAANYPYEARDAKCRARANLVVTRVRGSMTLPRGNENILRLVLALRGPLPVAIDASARSFHSYKSGVYDDHRACKSSPRSLNHAVLLVGYGRERRGEYWLLKNSWGREWGENGYIRIARNQRNLCGVASYAVLPLL